MNASPTSPMRCAERGARSAAGVANGATLPVVGTPRATGGSRLAPPVTATLDTPSRGRPTARPAPDARLRPLGPSLWPWVGATLFIFVAFVSARGALRAPAGPGASANGAAQAQKAPPSVSAPLRAPEAAPTSAPTPSVSSSSPLKRRDSSASFYAPAHRASPANGKRRPVSGATLPSSRVADLTSGAAEAKPAPGSGPGGPVEAPQEGTLQLLIVPEAEVTIDGASIGPVSM